MTARQGMLERAVRFRAAPVLFKEAGNIVAVFLQRAPVRRVLPGLIGDCSHLDMVRGVPESAGNIITSTVLPVFAQLLHCASSLAVPVHTLVALGTTGIQKVIAILVHSLRPRPIHEMMNALGIFVLSRACKSRPFPSDLGTIYSLLFMYSSESLRNPIKGKLEVGSYSDKRVKSLGSDWCFCSSTQRPQ